MSRRASRTSRLFTLVMATALTASSAWPAEGEVPIAVQAVFFKKIISYDQTLEGKPDPKVLVVHADDAGDEVEVVIKAFRTAGINVSSAKISTLSANVNGALIVYALGTGSSPGLKDLCAKQQVLSMSGAAANAINGHVGIALGTKADGKPEIIVNLAVLKTQGHRMSSSLLNLARVIQ